MTCTHTDVKEKLVQESNGKFREVLSPHKELAQQERKLLGTLPIKNIKSYLINLVGTFIVREPKYTGEHREDEADDVEQAVRHLAEEDPEFILKVAYYVRTKLYLRSTTNYLLSLILQTPKCNPFLSTWLSECMLLPNDLLEVVDLVRAQHGGKVPAVLKRAFNKKFKDFSMYQVGKYNNEKKLKRKRKLEKKRTAEIEAKKQQSTPTPLAGGGSAVVTTDTETDEERKVEETDQKLDCIPERPDRLGPLSLKQLVVQCHTSEPTDVVMSLIGKRYPTTEDGFKTSGLPGEFDSSRAGQRMKIPIPVTWETQLSAYGNTADTWEQLIDGKNLPFMAMLRNLRNLIEAGISENHHKKVQQRLTDEHQVAGSKQIPFRFLSAFEALQFTPEQLTQLLKDVNNPLSTNNTNDNYIEKTITFQLPSGKVCTRTKKKKVPHFAPTDSTIEGYKEALEEAVKISINHNLPPLRGSTAVFLDVSASMDAKLVKPKRHAQTAKSAKLHDGATGEKLKVGDDLDLDDAFATSGRHFSRVLEISMIWKAPGNVDLDLSAEMYNSSFSNICRVSWSQLKQPGIEHSGDITSAPDGAEEVIRVELDKLNGDVHALFFTINSYTGQRFCDMTTASVALRDAENQQEEIGTFPLAGNKKALVACALFRKQAGLTGKCGWTFRPINLESESGTLSRHLTPLMLQHFEDFKDVKDLPGKTLYEAGLLQALCLQYMSEESDIICFGSTSKSVTESLDKDKILNNVKILKEFVGQHIPIRGTVIPLPVIQSYIDEKKVWNTIVFITDAVLPKADQLRQLIEKYRQEVNPETVFVTINLGGAGTSIMDCNARETTLVDGYWVNKSLNLDLSGANDQVLGYIANYGTDQLKEIEELTAPAKPQHNRK